MKSTGRRDVFDDEYVERVLVLFEFVEPKFGVSNSSTVEAKLTERDDFSVGRTSS